MKVSESSGELADRVRTGWVNSDNWPLRADALWPLLLHPALRHVQARSLSGNCTLVALSCFIFMYRIESVTLLVQLA